METDSLIVTCGWMAHSAKPIGDLGMSFQLKPDEAYIYDCATRPDYRGRGYYPALLHFMPVELHREGCRRIWIGTTAGNAVLQRGMARAGFMKVADVNTARRGAGAGDAALYGVPGVPADLLAHATSPFPGHAHPDTGLPQEP